MRLWFVIMLSKFSRVLSRLIGKKGTTISGTLALRLDPNLLKKMNKDIKQILFVTGTNGKTTTSNLLANIMRETHQTVIHNQEGANMLTGVTACFIKASNWAGKVRTDIAVIEVDEGSLPDILKQLTPTRITILNFFRDQLDRYGEIDVLIRNMMNAIRPVDTELILNTDDPLVMQFDALEKKKSYVGVQPGAITFGNYAQGESVHCPNCGEEMNYRSLYYGQLGDFNCSCGFSRKQPAYEVSDVSAGQSLSFQIGELPYLTKLRGYYNVYNAAAAIATAFESGAEYNPIQKGLSQYDQKNGRMETFYHQGVPYILNLNKNPSGTNVMINELMSDKNKKQVLIILNDNVADGEDVSWIWDVEFEALDKEEIETIICSGSRSSELELRLKYADVNAAKIKNITDIQEAISYTLEHPVTTYILPTYTALEKAKQDLIRKVQTI